PRFPVHSHKSCHAQNCGRPRQRPGLSAAPGRAFWAASVLPVYPLPVPAFPRAPPCGAWTRRPAPVCFSAGTSSSQTSLELLWRPRRQNPPAPLLLLSPQSLATLRGAPCSGHFVQKCPLSRHRLGSRPQRPRKKRRRDRRAPPRSRGAPWALVRVYSVFASFFKSSGRVVSRL